MGSAPTPPVQTPVTFLQGGAADMFSAWCVEKLSAAGYSPKDFGSYLYVRHKVIKDAKNRVKDYEASLQPGSHRTVDPPSDHDKWLASCQSGHLTQNAVYQTERGNPCSNLKTAPGHHDGLFPCMPLAGNAHQDGGEHQLNTAHERVSAAAGGVPDATPGSRYPADQIEEDSDDRANKVAHNEELARRNGRNPLTPQGRAEGGSSGATSTPSRSTGNSGNVSGQDASEANKPWNKELTGETAGDCINAFRDAGEAAMRELCARARHRNRRIADGGKGKTPAQGQAHRARLNKAAADAEQEAKDNPNDKAKQEVATRARARATAAERANCKANQGDELANGYNGPFDGQVPQNYPSSTRSSNGTGPGLTEV